MNRPDIKEDAYAVTYDGAAERVAVTPPPRPEPAPGRRPGRSSGRAAPAARPAVERPTPAAPAAPRPAPAVDVDPADVDDLDDVDEPPRPEQPAPAGRATQRATTLVLGGLGAGVVLHFLGPIVLAVSTAGGVVLYLAGRRILRTDRPGRRLGSGRGGRGGRGGLSSTGRRPGRGGGLRLPKLGGTGGGRRGLSAGGGRRVAAARSGGLPKTGRGGTGRRAGGTGLPRAGRARSGGAVFGGGRPRRVGGLLGGLFGRRTPGQARAAARRAAMHGHGQSTSPGRIRRAARGLGRAARVTGRGAVAMGRGAAAAGRAARAVGRDTWQLDVWWSNLAQRVANLTYTLTIRPIDWLYHRTIVLPGRRIARWAYIRRRWLAAYGAPAAWRALLARLTPGWYRELRRLAVAHGQRAAWAAFWVAAVAAVATFFRSTLAGWVWAPATAPRHRAAPPRRPTTPVDEHDDERDTDPPLGTLHRPEPSRLIRPTPATTRPRPAPAQTGAPRMSPNVVLHPVLDRVNEISAVYVAGFQPRSIPDLERYLRSQPAALTNRAEIIDGLADRLAASFPGAVLVHEYFHNFTRAYREMAAPAHGLHQAYRDLHKGDIDRHENPRVHEEKADVVRRGAVTGPTIDGGDVMHEHHAAMSEAYRVYFGAYDPGADFAADDDAVADLMAFLETLGPAMVLRAEHMMTFAEHLVTAYPIDVRTHDYYYAFAGRYAHLADQAAELAAGYERRNPHDVMRRRAPRVNEQWADVTNV